MVADKPGEKWQHYFYLWNTLDTLILASKKIHTFEFIR